MLADSYLLYALMHCFWSFLPHCVEVKAIFLQQPRLKAKNMQFSAAQIAAIINGTTEGDTSVTVGSFGKIEEAIEGQLAFLANPKYEDFLYTTKASIVIVNDTLELKQ